MNQHPIETLEPVFHWLDWLIAERGWESRPAGQAVTGLAMKRDSADWYPVREPMHIRFIERHQLNIA